MGVTEAAFIVSYCAFLVGFFGFVAYVIYKYF